jgi:hypothetical protein
MRCLIFNCFFFYKQRKLQPQKLTLRTKRENRYILVHIYYFPVLIIIMLSNPVLVETNTRKKEERKGKGKGKLKNWRKWISGKSGGKNNGKRYF